MDANYDIQRISLPLPEIKLLAAEARGEGFRFIDRLLVEWRIGANRFAGAGEQLLGAFHGARLSAVGRINRDPYTTHPRVSQLRHLYVLRDYRRRAIASALVDRLLNEATDTFTVIRLRTTDDAAAKLYLSHGFEVCGDPHTSHRRVLAADA